MYEIYSVIGVILIITGLISSVYFTLHIKRSNFEKYTINHLIDGLGALLLGILYIFSFVELKESLKQPSSTLTFQEETYLNVSDEPLTLTFFPTLPTSTNQQTSTHEVFKEYDETSHFDVDTKPPATTEIFLINSSTSTFNSTEEMTMFPLVDNLKNDSFKFYQNFFKDIIQKNTADNSKFMNRTIFYNNKQYGKSIRNKTQTRIKRETQEYVNPMGKCFRRVFLKHALLICSFLYSVICIINTTKFCYEHKSRNNHVESEKEKKAPSLASLETSLESSQKSLFVKINEKLDDTEKETGIEEHSEKSSPNLDMFLAKKNEITDQKDENIKMNLEEKVKKNWLSKNALYILKVIVIWFSPGLCIFSLHILMDRQSLHNSSINLDFMYNFEHTKVDPNLLKLINNPPDTKTQPKSKEINDIIKNVYNIMKGISKQPETKNVLSSDVMYDIIHHLNRKHDGEYKTSDCSFNTPTLKIHSFVIFCIIYIGSIFYCKILEVKMKFEGNIFIKFLKLYMYSYIIMWLPCILELFSRTYILNENLSRVSDAPLALANLFIVFSNFSNYLLNKKTRKICEIVKI